MQVVRKRGNQRKWGEEQDETLKRMHAEGCSPMDISVAVGFCMSKVMDMHYRHRLKPNRRPIKPVFETQKPPPLPVFKQHPLDLAAEVLPGFDREQMRLNGTPIRFLDLMREVNRVLKAMGRPQWDGDDSCVVR